MKPLILYLANITMKKFLWCLFLTICFAALPHIARAQQPLGASALATPEIRGIWVHTYQTQPWDIVMKKIAEAGFNCVFVRVARGVNALYPSKILPMDAWAEDAWKSGQGQDELKTMIGAAHRNGLEFHAWKVNFNAGAGMRAGAGPAAFYQKLSEQDRLARGPSGVPAPFLNPGDPRNRQMEFDVMMELLQNYDIDGLHFDYIRYTDTGPGGVEDFDYDYGEVSRREFEKVLGRRVQNWPAAVFSGDLKIPYEEWERGNINNLVSRVYAATKQRKPRVMVSAAVWRANRKYRAGIKQDWTRWARESWLDFVVPMDYSADAARFGSDLDEQIPNVAGHIPLAAGIGTYLQKTPEDVVKQIQIARDKGADGYVLFSYQDDKIEAILDLLKQGVNASAAVPAYRAPRVKWEIEGGIARRDAPTAFAIGESVLAGVAFEGRQKTWKRAQTSVILESLDGTQKRDLGAELNYPDTSPRGGGFSVPAGIWRLVLRGQATDAQGKVWPLAVGGPLVEGLDENAIAALQAREVPPKFAKGKRRVAIYAGGQASAGLLRALKNAPGVDAQMIYFLRPAMWREADVLIVPHLSDVAELDAEKIAALRAYVRGGGRLILTHDAVGYRWHPRLFPEIGVGVELSKTRDLVVGQNDLGLTPGALAQGYGDHVVIQGAPGASVLAREKEGDKAVVVAGQFGRGTVVMDGALLGYPSDGEMPDSEKRLLWELVG